MKASSTGNSWFLRPLHKCSSQPWNQRPHWLKPQFMGNFPSPGIGNIFPALDWQKIQVGSYATDSPQVLVLVVSDQPIAVVVVEDVVVGPDPLPHRPPVSHHAGHLEVAAHVADQHGGRVSFVAYLHHVRKVVKEG